MNKYHIGDFKHYTSCHMSYISIYNNYVDFTEHVRHTGTVKSWPTAAVKDMINFDIQLIFNICTMSNENYIAK